MSPPILMMLPLDGLSVYGDPGVTGIYESWDDVIAVKLDRGEEVLVQS